MSHLDTAGLIVLAAILESSERGDRVTVLRPFTAAEHVSLRRRLILLADYRDPTLDYFTGDPSIQDGRYIEGWTIRLAPAPTLPEPT